MSVQTIHDGKVYVVVIDDCYDYERDLHLEVFINKKHAKNFFDMKIKQFKENRNYKYDEIVHTETAFSAYDDGFYERDHYDITIYEKEAHIYEKIN